MPPTEDQQIPTKPRCVALLYMGSDGRLETHEFPDLWDLCSHVLELGLSRYDFAITEGQLLKAPPEPGDIIFEHLDDETDGNYPESTVTALPPAQLQNIIEQGQFE